MRTIIDIPEDLVARLDALRRQTQLSRAEIIRRALRWYLEHTKVQAIEEDEAFGLWRERNIDALAYEDGLREEWDRF
ncbi:MAG: ribbon-helix-helix domain-containing protein [Methylohalobius sp.]|nr:ribbon-helix-helix domain-containing protein [Methylohalobius sp.]